MKVCGIIAEYNPFHNGHAYQIRTVREQTGADYVIVVMSPDFVQRGEPAMIDKYARTEMALHGGADLVLELPVLFAVSGAEYFARGGVSLLDRLGCVDDLAFGTELSDPAPLYDAAKRLAEEPKAYSDRLSALLKSGFNFPAARERALQELAHQDMQFLRSPNNILALEYLLALARMQSQMHPAPIRRVGADYHNTDITEIYASASAIRGYLCGAKTDSDLSVLKGSMPAAALSILHHQMQHGGTVTSEDFAPAINYLLLHTESSDSIRQYFDIDPYLADRIWQNRYAFTSFEEFCDLCCSKNQTKAHIRRALCHMLLQIRAASMKQDTKAAYTRILGFRRDAVPLLHQIKESSMLPVITKMADAAESIGHAPMTERAKADAQLQLEQTVFSSHLYDSVLALRMHRPVRHENTRRIIIL